MSKAELEERVAQLEALAAELAAGVYVTLDYSADDTNPHRASVPVHAILSIRR